MLWLPEGLYGCDFVRGSLADEFRYLISTLVRKATFRDTDSHGYALLHTPTLHRVLTRNSLRPMIEAAVKGDVIEVDRHYRRGSKSRGYRLAPKWLQQRCMFRPATDTRLIARIERE